MNWAFILQIAGAVGGVATLLAFLLAPMFYLGNKIDAFRAEVQNDMNEFRRELKDYHGRLSCLEERSRK